MIAFFVALIFLCPVLACFVFYPLLLKAVITLCGKRSVSPTVAESKPLPVDLLLSVANEEAVIARTIDTLLARAEEAGDVGLYVYVDGATDGTEGILRGYEDRLILVVGAERVGKNAALNVLAAKGAAPLMLFTDANTQIQPGAIEGMRRYFRDPAIGCVQGYCQVTSGEAGSTASSLGGAYWRFEEGLKQLESDTGNMMGADGALFTIRRQYWRDLEKGVNSDLFTSLTVLLEGGRAVRAPDCLAEEKASSDNAEEFKRRIRIANRAMATLMILRREIRRKLSRWDRFKLYQHRFIRPFTIFFLTGSGGALFAGLWQVWSLQIALLVYGLGALVLAIGYAAKWRPARLVVSALLFFLGAGIGAVTALFGKRTDIWTPPKSAR